MVDPKLWKILVVDDDPFNVEILEEILDDEGYDSRSASSGEEALATMREFRPDLVLLDIMMPGLDGFEICQKIRADPENRHAKILLVSGKAMLKDRLKAYEVGADDHVAKPFEHAELAAKIRVFLRLKPFEEVDQLKTDFYNMFNHEVRIPLTGIMAPGELLAHQEQLEDEERRELGALIVMSAEQLRLFFEQVEALSKFKAGTAKLAMERIDLVELVSLAVEDGDAVAVEKQVDIQIRAPESLILEVDRERILFVLMTLLGNARGCSPVDAPVIVELREEGVAVTVSITDHGPSINEESGKDVFDEFDPSNVDHHSRSWGPSLALSRAIVEAHCGSIHCCSESRSGTCFEFRLVSGSRRRTVSELDSNC